MYLLVLRGQPRRGSRGGRRRSIGAPRREPSETVPDGSSLDQALSWLDHLSEEAPEVPQPAFAVLEDVLTRAAGQDGLIKARQYVHGRWIYSVFVGGCTQKMGEDALMTRPIVDSPDAWVQTQPVPADRFAATLTRAKISRFSLPLKSCSDTTGRSLLRSAPR